MAIAANLVGATLPLAAFLSFVGMFQVIFFKKILVK